MTLRNRIADVADRLDRLGDRIKALAGRVRGYLASLPWRP